MNQTRQRFSQLCTIDQEQPEPNPYLVLSASRDTDSFIARNIILFSYGRGKELVQRLYLAH